MNYTGNYQLPQWVESDRVLMEDFNGCNSKVDGALAALQQCKSEFHLLKEETLSAQQADWSISLDGIDWGAWRFLFLNISLTGSGVYYLRPNGSGAVSYHHPGGASTNGGLAELRTGESWTILLLPFQSPAAELVSLSLVPTVVTGICDFSDKILYCDLASVQLFRHPNFSDSYLSAGSRLSLWAI